MAASSGRDTDAITDINITPMVDVVLVLLIIFMATAPLIARRALSVQLPKSARAERAATETARVELNLKRELLLDGRKLSVTDLDRELKRLVELQPAIPLRDEPPHVAGEAFSSGHVCRAIVRRPDPADRLPVVAESPDRVRRGLPQPVEC